MNGFIRSHFEPSHRDQKYILLFPGLLALCICPAVTTLTQASVDASEQNSEGIQTKAKQKKVAV